MRELTLNKLQKKVKEIEHKISLIMEEQGTSALADERIAKLMRDKSDVQDYIYYIETGDDITGRNDDDE